MIVYKNILQKLKDAGYTSYRLRQESLLPESTIQQIRNEKPVSLKSIDVICRLLDCPIEEVVVYVPDPEDTVQ